MTSDKTSRLNLLSLVVLNLMTIATETDFKDRSFDLNDKYDFDEDDDVDAMMGRKILEEVTWWFLRGWTLLQGREQDYAEM